MASMNNKERAQHYFELLLKSSDPKAELQKIYLEIDRLVFAASQKPIDRETKIQILDELERLIRSKPGLEHFGESKKYDSVGKATAASDNSEILDVISAMKKGAK